MGHERSGSEARPGASSTCELPRSSTRGPAPSFLCLGCALHTTSSEAAGSGGTEAGRRLSTSSYTSPFKSPATRCTRSSSSGSRSSRRPQLLVPWADDQPAA